MLTPQYGASAYLRSIGKVHLHHAAGSILRSHAVSRIVLVMMRSNEERIWLDVRGHPVRTKPLWTIYLVTDPNGKQYIGATAMRFEGRLRDHISSYPSGSLHQAIKRLGADQFTVTIIGEALTVKDARRKEEAAIRERNTLSPNGYNKRPSSGLHDGVRFATPAEIASG